MPDDVKQRYLAAPVTDTVVTTALDGAPQRVIRTDADRRARAVDASSPASRGRSADAAALPPGRPARRCSDLRARRAWRCASTRT